MINLKELVLTIEKCSCCKKEFSLIDPWSNSYSDEFKKYNEKRVIVTERIQEFYVHNKQNVKTCRQSLGIIESEPYILCKKCVKLRDKKNGKVWLIDGKFIEFIDFLKKSRNLNVYLKKGLIIERD